MRRRGREGLVSLGMLRRGDDMSGSLTSGSAHGKIPSGVPVCNLHVSCLPVPAALFHGAFFCWGACI